MQGFFPWSNNVYYPLDFYKNNRPIEFIATTILSNIILCKSYNKNN